MSGRLRMPRLAVFRILAPITDGVQDFGPQLTRIRQVLLRPEHALGFQIPDQHELTGLGDTDTILTARLRITGDPIVLVNLIRVVIARATVLLRVVPGHQTTQPV